jgi:hypothetical protein
VGCLNKAAHYGRCGLIVSGPARTGKTTAITQLGKTIEVIQRRRHPRSGNDIPVVYITVPPAATPKMIAVGFARFLGLSLNNIVRQPEVKINMRVFPCVSHKVAGAACRS